MAKKNKSLFESKGWKKGTAMLYGIGASVVIIGALFKILHFPGADEMLIVGLSTEAVIFFVSAFEPLPHEETHWSWHKVFPELRGDVDTEDLDDEEIDLAGEEMGLQRGGGSATYNTLSSGLTKANNLLADGNLNPQIIEDLTNSIQGLKVNVTNLAEISDATVATQEFSDKLRSAAGKIDQLNSGYSTTVSAMNEFGKAIDDVRSYQTQIQTVTQNLQSLSAVYQLELEDAQKHLSSINKFYGGIASVMQNLVDTSKETEVLRQEVTSLSKNLASLNSIYGGMLNAMAAAGQGR